MASLGLIYYEPTCLSQVLVLKQEEDAKRLEEEKRLDEERRAKLAAESSG